MTDREQIRRDSADIERDVVTVRGFVDYPTASGRDVYLRAVEALDRLALDAHRAEQAERERDEAHTQIHSLRWLLGLDTHPGEEEQSATASHANLDALLREPTREVQCSAEAQLAAVPALVDALRDGIVVFVETDWVRAAKKALAVWKQAQK